MSPPFLCYSMISFCPGCGKSVKVSFKFCPYCGNALPIEEDEGTQTGSKPLVSSFRGSRRDLSSGSETSPKKVKWSHTVTSLPLSLHSDCDSSGSDDTLSSPDRATGTWSRPLTPKGSPLSNRLSPRTLKRSQVTTSLQALPTGTELTDQNGKHWTLGALQTRDDQGILYEGIHCPSAWRCSRQCSTTRTRECNTLGQQLHRGKMGGAQEGGCVEQSSSDLVSRSQRRAWGATRARGSLQEHAPVTSFLQLSPTSQ